MIEIYNQLNSKTVNLYSLILAAEGLKYRIQQDGRRWSLWVTPEDRNSALEAIVCYLRENGTRGFIHHQLEFFTLRSYPIWGLCGLLILIHWFSLNFLNRHFFLNTYALDAASVLNGETYRCLTALFIHKDLLHLLSNCLCLLLFGAAVCQRAGWAVGIILIITSGIFGNLVNAMFYEEYHRAIGFSTAIFGAVGFISVFQLIDKRKHGLQKSRLWIYPASGLALLSILGASAQSDVLAHLWGFLSGSVCAVAYASIIKKPIQRSGQRRAFLVFATIVFFSWLKPLI